MRLLELTEAEVLVIELALMQYLAMLSDHIKASELDDPDNERRRVEQIRAQQALHRIRYTH